MFYDKNELIEANKNPIIRHYWNTKPWEVGKSSKIYNEFCYYAMISNLYSYMCNELLKNYNMTL